MSTTTEMFVRPGSNHPPSREGNARWLDRYRAVRGLTEELCRPLETEDYVIQSMPDASPAKWHLAHTTWFFDTFILQHARGEKSRECHPGYGYLFNSYYNAVGPMHCRARRGMISRPTVRETFQYRREVDELMSGLILNTGDREWQRLEKLIELGLHHEQQHQELLLTDLKHLFAQNPLYPVYNRAQPDGAKQPHPPLKWVAFEEGLQWIGHQGTGFAFDNEQPRHREFIPAFRLASRLVTNAEYVAFIEMGGYKRPEFWLSLGWFTANENKWTAPLYWEQRDGRWWHYTLSGFRPLIASEPVCHISYFEADAFARWAGARLPTEAEWEIAAAHTPVSGNFIESKRLHPHLAQAPASGDLSQLFGDVWEWTRSAYSPYPGYAPPQGAVGEYNGKFMCNQYVLRGGSCATPQTHVRHTYRNFFAPDKRWQFSGVRLAQDAL